MVINKSNILNRIHFYLHDSYITSFNDIKSFLSEFFFGAFWPILIWGIYVIVLYKTNDSTFITFGAVMSVLIWILSSTLYCAAYDRDSHFYKSFLYQIDSIGLVKSFKKDPLVFLVLNLMPIFILPVSLIVLFCSLFVFPYRFITQKLSNIELKTSNNIAKEVMDEINKNKK